MTSVLTAFDPIMFTQQESVQDVKFGGLRLFPIVHCCQISCSNWFICLRNLPTHAGSSIVGPTGKRWKSFPNRKTVSDMPGVFFLFYLWWFGDRKGNCQTQIREMSGLLLSYDSNYLHSWRHIRHAFQTKTLLNGRGDLTCRLNCALSVRWGWIISLHFDALCPPLMSLL